MKVSPKLDSSTRAAPDRTGRTDRIDRTSVTNTGQDPSDHPRAGW